MFHKILNFTFQKFQEDLRGQQPNIERIRFMAEEILQSCHPNAVRFVKYYLTITQTRWEQVNKGITLIMALFMFYPWIKI